MQQLIRDRVEIDPATGCWVWQCQIEYHGYGRAYWAGRRQYAHRLAYEAFVGPIPVDREIDHLCRVRACVNPAHLELVTHQENMDRRAGASAATCMNGHPRIPQNIKITRQGRRRCLACLREAWTRAAHRRQLAAS